MSSARRILTVLIPASSLIFFSSLLVSSTFYYSSKQVKLNDAVISSLQSPNDNPRGYPNAGAGTAISAMLFLPAAAFFFRTLVRGNRIVATAGSLIYTLGLIAALLIGCIAPFPRLYDHVHIPLAYAAFIAIATGLLICLALASYPLVRKGGTSGIAMLPLVLILLVVVLYLFYLVLAPGDHAPDHGLLNNVAFVEWALSVCIALYTAILTVVLSGWRLLE